MPNTRSPALTCVSEYYGSRFIWSKDVIKPVLFAVNMALLISSTSVLKTVHKPLAPFCFHFFFYIFHIDRVGMSCCRGSTDPLIVSDHKSGSWAFGSYRWGTCKTYIVSALSTCLQLLNTMVCLENPLDRAVSAQMCRAKIYRITFVYKYFIVI